jgi:plastocyanin
MRMRATLIAALLATAVALTACGGGDDASEAPAQASVRIADFKFTPATVSVRSGGSVRFTNGDRAEHTATLSGGFDTGTLRRGQSKSVVLQKPGSFVYRCDFHPFMTAEVVVEK